VRWCVSIGAVLVAAAVAGGDVAGFAAPNPQISTGRHKDNLPSVDIELVIAVDVSYSMDLDELAVQREGYAEAIVSKDFPSGDEERSEPQGGGDVFRVVGIERPEDHHSLAGD